MTKLDELLRVPEQVERGDISIEEAEEPLPKEDTQVNKLNEIKKENRSELSDLNKTRTESTEEGDTTMEEKGLQRLLTEEEVEQLANLVTKQQREVLDMMDELSKQVQEEVVMDNTRNAKAEKVGVVVGKGTSAIFTGVTIASVTAGRFIREDAAPAVAKGARTGWSILKGIAKGAKEGYVESKAKSS